MRAFTWLRARPRAVASVSVVSAAVVAIGAMAFAYEGKPTTEVDLHDGGVWVTKQSSLLIGHLNNESGVLDGGLRTSSNQYDVQQNGARVLVVDPVASTATSIDPARVQLSENAELPAGAQVTLGGGTVAVAEPKGPVWAAEFSGLAGIAQQGSEPIADLGKNTVATVGTDGTVYAASGESGKIVTLAPVGGGVIEQKAERQVEGLKESSELTMTSVGQTGYLLDAATDTLFGSDGTTIEMPSDLVLQQPSEASDTLAAASSTALLRVDADGEIDTVESGGAEGTPAAPVFVDGCTYAAWSGSARFIRDCPGKADDVVQEIEGLPATAQLKFRVNRDVVVLNDIFGGTAWLASDAMQRVDNWDDLTPPEGEGEEEEETTEETVETTLPERTEKNTDPIANDDKFGVRPGRTTVLPVLENDTDADGDVLVATLESDPAFGEIEQVHNGQALQITVPEDATGTMTFRYKADDGRTGTDEAKVTVSVHGWEVNAPPVQKRTTPVTVEAGGTASYNVLPDWIDPDGDDIFLQSVTTEGGDEADFTSDGQITFRAIGGTQGRIDVPVVVSDGDEGGSGVARYEVRPLGTTVPVTNADHVVTRAGRSVTVSPLVNDTSTGREPLRLTRVEPVDGTEIVPDYADKTFSFSADAVGTYYVEYLVSSGPNSVAGIVRVDVLPESEKDLPPIAVRDVALLPSGDDVLVNVLSNDTDPGGGILVVQSVTAEPGSGVAAAVLGHETIRISDLGNLSDQVRVGYTISNGTQSAEGEIVVIPVPAPEKLRPPVANDDEAVVRAGDVVTIPVLDNDYHPNNDKITVSSELIPPLVEPEDGEAFVAEDTVRFRASDEPGTSYVTYEVVDSTGQRDAGYVTIQVLPRDDEGNAAPRPRDLTARTLSGSSVPIPVPLDGIDEDGDSVELIGLASSPSKGRIEATADDSFEYSAFDDSVGVDTFTYRVRDRLGKEGTATIQVGIAPAGSVNQAPYAVRDSVVMRPDREVALPVLENDSDPDGELFGFAENAVKVPDVAGLDAKVSGKHLIITSPGAAMQTSVHYTIADARGLTSTTSVQITVDPEVPLLDPIARDDRVRPEDVSEEGTADIAVLENDDDPDGTREQLSVELGEGGETARVAADGTVRVTLTDERQLITYTITDADDQTATAFLHVPANNDLPPSLIDATTAVEVKSGETIELPLAEYVQAAGGKDVVVTEAAKVTAAHSNGASLVQDQHTLVYTSADRYYGQDALTFEVTDGTGPDDPKGRKATLTIPITVLPPDNVAPEMVGASMNVAPGEDASTLNLAELANDPDPDDTLSFRLEGGVPDGMSASVDGTVLSVSADTNTPKGTTASIMVSVTDGEAAAVQAPITVTVTASTRELASANDDIIEEADQGETLSIPVLRNDVNPFPDTPLKVVEVATETGDAVPVINGDSVEVTSGADFVGTVVVRYRVLDATEDVDRAVDGRIRITVQGRPDAPGKPTVSSVQSRTVVLSWTPPIDNGTPITGYTVRSTSGAVTQDCASTTCTITGLTNNVEYNFTVTATNRVGESEPSIPSETARPDQRPETPAPPTLAFADQALKVAWTTPPTEGSPVETFTLEISPAPASGVSQKTGVPGNTITWDGLQNGTSYKVRVRAHNRAPEPSGWSAWSAGEIPARQPDAPAAPTTERIDSVGTQNQMRVTWNQPANNGDAIAGYQLNVLQGGSVVRTVAVAAGQTSQAVTVDNSTTSYTFQVRAQNKAGWGAWSPESAPRQSFGQPSAPTSVSAQPGDNRVTVSWTDGSTNGASSSQISYQYSVNGGAWRADWVSVSNGQGVVGNGQANNNGAYTVRVRMIATVGGATEQGQPSAESNQVRPYGSIGNPTAKATASGTKITFSWTAPARNGRDITTEIRTENGQGWRVVARTGGESGSETVDVGYSTTKTIYVRSTAAGQTTTAQDSARTQDEPPRASASASKSSTSAQGQPGCSSSRCRYVVVNTSNFPAGRYQVDCYVDGRRFDTTNDSFNLPANGSTRLGCYYGGYGNVYAKIIGWGDTSGVNW